MKIEQETAEFKPITITLETRREAEAFIHFVDYLSRCGLDPNSYNFKFLNDVSNAFTNLKAVV